MDSNYFWILLISLLFVFYTFIVRLEGKTWLAPSSFFTLIWAVTIIVAVLFAPNFYFSIKAILFVLSALLMFFIGSFVLNVIAPSNISNNYINNTCAELNLPFLKKFIIVGVISSLIAVVLLLKIYNVNLLSGFSLDVYIDTASKMSIDRYAGLSLPKPIMIFLSLGYAGCLCGGSVFAFSKKKTDKFLALSSIFSILLFTIIYTARAVFLFSLMLFISSYLSTKLYLFKYNFKLFSLKKIMIIIFLAFFLFLMFLTTQISRYGIKNFEFNEILKVLDHLKVWFFGNISGFSRWFDNVDLNNTDFNGGKYLFAGIFDFLGISSRNIGLFTEYYCINDQNEFTNIFGIFRVLIEDFTIFGIYPLLFLAGILSNIIYKSVLNGKILFIPLLVMFYAFTLWSFITNIFAYNTTIIACFIYFFIILHVKLTSKPATKQG